MFRFIIYSTIILQLTACTNSENQQFKYNLLVFGTLTEITLSQTNVQTAQKTFEEIENYFNKMHQHWHAWQGDGLLMQINENIALNKTTQVDKDTVYLINLSKQVNKGSKGRFDPAIGKIIALWGFHTEPNKWQPPNQKKLEVLINDSPSINDIKIKQGQLHSKNNQVKLDFGGIAKGFLLKKAIEIVKNNGIKNAIINAGGDICVLGGAKNRNWNIAIRHPNKKQLLASIKLEPDECIMTSGGYERFYEYQGKKYSHIIDPRTGYPADQIQSVSIIDSNGGLADAVATALSISDKKEWQLLGQKLGVKAIIALDKKNQIFISENIKKRVKILTGE